MCSVTTFACAESEQSRTLRAPWLRRGIAPIGWLVLHPEPRCGLSSGAHWRNFQRSTPAQRGLERLHPLIQVGPAGLLGGECSSDFRFIRHGTLHLEGGVSEKTLGVLE